jgi:nitronate monooxygenase
VRLLGDDTVHTTVFDRLPGPEWPAGCTGRAAANATTRRWHGRAGLDAVLDDERERYRAAAAADDLDTRVLWAGESVDHIDAIVPATQVVRQVHEDAQRWFDAGR